MSRAIKSFKLFIFITFPHWTNFSFSSLTQFGIFFNTSRNTEKQSLSATYTTWYNYRQSPYSTQDSHKHYSATFLRVWKSIQWSACSSSRFCRRNIDCSRDLYLWPSNMETCTFDPRIWASVSLDWLPQNSGGHPAVTLNTGKQTQSLLVWYRAVGQRLESSGYFISRSKSLRLSLFW